VAVPGEPVTPKPSKPVTRVCNPVEAQKPERPENSCDPFDPTALRQGFRQIFRWVSDVFQQLPVAFSGGFVEENSQGINSIIFMDWFDYYGIRV
jgi:hypothetical protein